tara:strand:+ start:2062 stop:2316 length:255 start_codon:yes stop_codon:yes gene_type:complete
MKNNDNNIEIDFGNDNFKIQAKLKMDGDLWCVGIGSDLQRGLYAFDETPVGAIAAFKDRFRNYSPNKATEIFSGTNEALSNIRL